MHINISTRVFIRIQCSVILFLLFASTVYYVVRDITGLRHFFGLGPTIDVGVEGNLPTLFSVLNFLVAAFLLTWIARLNDARRPELGRYWKLLAWGFLYLSLDEGAQIHENFGRLYELTGAPFAVFETHLWLPVGIVLALVVAGFYVPFLLRIPRRLAIRMCLSGSIFLLGAIGFEFVGAYMFHSELAERGDLIYDLRRIAEEGCEMAGIAYFNIVLLSELNGQRLICSIDDPKGLEWNTPGSK